MRTMGMFGRLFVLGVAVVGLTASTPSAERTGPITAEQATAIALAQTGGGRVMELDSHNRGGGAGYFRLEILGDDGRYHVEIDAAGGKLIKFIKKGGHSDYNKMNAPLPSAAANAGAGLTFDQALAVAMERTGGGTVVESDVDHKRDGRVIYEFEILNDGAKFEIEIDAASGGVIEFKRETKRSHAAVPQTSPTASSSRAGTQLSPDAAQAKALERTGGGLVTGYKLDTDDGRLVHEITIHKDNQRHKLEIDDASGAVSEYSLKTL